MPRSVPASCLLSNALEKLETYLASIFPVTILEVGTVLADQARMPGRDLFCSSSFSLALEIATLFSSRKPSPTITWKILSLLLSQSKVSCSLAPFLELVFSNCDSNYSNFVKHWDSLEDTWSSEIKINYFYLNALLVCVHATILYSSVICANTVLHCLFFSKLYMCIFLYILY